MILMLNSTQVEVVVQVKVIVEFGNIIKSNLLKIVSL